MSASPPPGLFKPPQQGHSLATLVLIENSVAMVDRWPDLRDHYLPTLLGTVRKVNPVVPVRYSAHLFLHLSIERLYLSTSIRYRRFRFTGSPAVPSLPSKRPLLILIIHAPVIYQKSVSAHTPTIR
jgi:hypothetical protein